MLNASTHRTAKGELGWPEGVRGGYSQDYGISSVNDTAFALLDDLWCPPGSSALSECTYKYQGTRKCQHYEAASIKCFMPTHTPMLLEPPPRLCQRQRRVRRRVQVRRRRELRYTDDGGNGQ